MLTATVKMFLNVSSTWILKIEANTRLVLCFTVPVRLSTTRLCKNLVRYFVSSLTGYWQMLMSVRNNKLHFEVCWGYLCSYVKVLSWITDPHTFFKPGWMKVMLLVRSWLHIKSKRNTEKCSCNAFCWCWMFFIC